MRVEGDRCGERFVIADMISSVGRGASLYIVSIVGDAASVYGSIAAVPDAG